MFYYKSKSLYDVLLFNYYSRFHKYYGNKIVSLLKKHQIPTNSLGLNEETGEVIVYNPPLGKETTIRKNGYINKSTKLYKEIKYIIDKSHIFPKPTPERFLVSPFSSIKYSVVRGVTYVEASGFMDNDYFDVISEDEYREKTK